MVDKVRTAHAELIGLANTTQDDGLAQSLREIANQLQRTRRTQPNTPELTPREVEVLAQVGMGCTYAEVAGRLALQPVTVKGYMSNVLAKLQVTNRHEAVVVARQCGIIP